MSGIIYDISGSLNMERWFSLHGIFSFDGISKPSFKSNTLLII